MQTALLKIEQERIRIQKMADKEKNPLTRASYVGMFMAYSNAIKAIKDDLAKREVEQNVGRD